MSQELLSVGIDIGTTSTQLVFSRLVIEDQGAYFSAPNIEITDKQIVYASPVYFTPLINLEVLNAEKIRAIVEKEYNKAGITKDQVKTGAVIITGESARKENSRTVLEKLSSYAGEFVVSTAGPDLESIIAGKGSGAYEYSRTHHCTVANIDIGGGTTNIVVFEDGVVIGKTCLDLGGRLVRISNKKVTYISPSVRRILLMKNISLKVGQPVLEKEIRSLCECMAEMILQAVGKPIGPELNWREFQSADSSSLQMDHKKIKLFFSGGVADLINNQQADYTYGDIGSYLGNEIYKKISKISNDCIFSKETIRATVIGAGMYTTEISGSTIMCSLNHLPIKNVPVFYLEKEEMEALEEIEKRMHIVKKLDWFLKQCDAEQFAIGFYGIKSPTFSYLKQMARGLKLLYDTISYEKTILVVSYHDCAKALGQLLDAEFHYRRELLCIDRIIVNESDYIDFGEPLMDGRVVPVVVKTLLFSK